MRKKNNNNNCVCLELSLLAASPEDGDPPGLSLAEVPGLLGPMVPRVQTIVVSAQKFSRNLPDSVTKPLLQTPETNFPTDQITVLPTK